MPRCRTGRVRASTPPATATQTPAGRARKVAGTSAPRSGPAAGRCATRGWRAELGRGLRLRCPAWRRGARPPPNRGSPTLIGKWWCGGDNPLQYPGARGTAQSPAARTAASTQPARSYPCISLCIAPVFLLTTRSARSACLPGGGAAIPGGESSQQCLPSCCLPVIPPPRPGKADDCNIRNRFRVIFRPPPGL